MAQQEVLPAEFESEPQEVDLSEGGFALALTRAEVDQQITTARRYPRSLTLIRQRMHTLVTLDEESAEECMYVLPRGQKSIQGPSIRFAECLKSTYGNCRVASRTTMIDKVEKFVEAEGVFHDLESNSAVSCKVRRRISTSRGALYNDDMILQTCNAAASIALRNAILGGVPKPIWRSAYEAVVNVIAGDITTLTATRTKALQSFALFGVAPAAVFEAIGVNGEEDITIDKIPVIRGMFSALKNGESTVEEMFRPKREAADPDYNPLVRGGTAAKRVEGGSQPKVDTPADTKQEQEPLHTGNGSAAGEANSQAPAAEGQGQVSAEATLPLNRDFPAKYHNSLKRASTAIALSKADQMFGDANPLPEDASANMMTEIYRAHERRIAENTPMATIDEIVVGIIGK